MRVSLEENPNLTKLYYWMLAEGIEVKQLRLLLQFREYIQKMFCL